MLHVGMEDIIELCDLSPVRADASLNHESWDYSVPHHAVVEARLRQSDKIVNVDVSDVVEQVNFNHSPGSRDRCGVSPESCDWTEVAGRTSATRIRGRRSAIPSVAGAAII